jgi:hypothetical protein
MGMSEWDFNCFDNDTTSALLHIYFLVFLSVVLLMLFSASPGYAEEPKVFTDSDLGSYNTAPMVDEETQSRMENDLQSYKKKKDAELLLDRERTKKKQAEEAKRAALQKQKEDAAAAAAAAAKKNSGNNSASGYRVSPVRRA